MDDTLYDFVIGSIDVSKLLDMSRIAAACVVTRSQAQEPEKEYRKLKVPEQIIGGDKDAFKLAQRTDPKLGLLKHKVQSGSVSVMKGLNRGET